MAGLPYPRQETSMEDMFNTAASNLPSSPYAPAYPPAAAAADTHYPGAPAAYSPAAYPPPAAAAAHPPVGYPEALYPPAPGYSPYPPETGYHHSLGASPYAAATSTFPVAPLPPSYASGGPAAYPAAGGVPYPPPSYTSDVPYPPSYTSGAPPYPPVEVGGVGGPYPPPVPLPYPDSGLFPEEAQQARVEANGGLVDNLGRGLQRMALEKFNTLLNTPTLPSHHFPVRPGGGDGGPSAALPPAYYSPGAAGGGGTQQRDQPMKITNFEPSQDYHQLRRQHSSSRLFEDPTFRPSNKLLTDSNGQDIVISYYGRKHNYRGPEIEWLRPHEICQKNGYQAPQMFVKNMDRFDINQGEIGDCWFLAALANLAENQEAFKRVVPKDQGFEGSRYAGIFRFRFYSFGEWIEVVIDDRLPTRNGKLIYLKSTEKHEFWSALLEKAYAKLYGSYRALEGGLTIEAAVDFTGGIPEMVDLTSLKTSKEELFYKLLRADQNNAFLSCSLANSRYQKEAESKGLQSRHAYTITKVVDVRSTRERGSIPLIRMRNPHGNSREWKGDWSDGDIFWKYVDANTKRELGLDFRDDGEFYMNFNRDFLKYFGEVEIVHLSPSDMHSSDSDAGQFDLYHFFGTWSRAMATAGGCGNDTIKSFAENPQFLFSITDPNPYDAKQTCNVVIALAQKPRERKKEHAIGFRIYSIPPGTNQVDYRFLMYNKHLAKTEQYINLREVSLSLALGQGEYVVIPSTFARGEEGEFLLRLFIDEDWGSTSEGVKQATGGGGGGGAAGLPRDGGGRRAVGGPRDHHVRGTGGFASKVINIPIQILGEENQHGGRKDGKSSSLTKILGRNVVKAMGLDMHSIKQKFPTFAALLQVYYSWSKDKDSELSLFKTIVNSLKPGHQLS